LNLQSAEHILAECAYKANVQFLKEKERAEEKPKKAGKRLFFEKKAEECSFCSRFQPLLKATGSG